MVWIKRKKEYFHLETWGGLNSNLEFEFKRNFNHSNINSKLKRKDHAYESSPNMELILTKTTLAWINLKTQT